MADKSTTSHDTASPRAVYLLLQIEPVLLLLLFEHTTALCLALVVAILNWMAGEQFRLKRNGNRTRSLLKWSIINAVACAVVLAIAAHFWLEAASFGIAAVWSKVQAILKLCGMLLGLMVGSRVLAGSLDKLGDRLVAHTRKKINGST
jgi:hypothetical protein